MRVVIVVGAVLIIGVIFIYNALIRKKNQVANVFGTIDVMLKKRYDLLPNLVAAVKAYMTHERELLEEVTKMRARAVSERLSDDEQVELDNVLSKILGRLMVVVENYPDLKANENFMHLQRTMNELEEQISAARRAYNAVVTDYNNAVEMFPTNVAASMMGYKQKKWFEIPEEQRRQVDADKLLEK